MQNMFSGEIPPAELAKALELFRKGADVLQPYLTPRTPEERQDMLKMGPASVSFVDKARSYARDNANFRPAFLDFDEFTRDADALLGLAPIHQLLAGLDLDTDSTMMTAGSDAYVEALMVYNYVKMLAQHGTPGAQAAYEDMRSSMPSAHGRGGRKKS
jgi:hypothetical protein